MTEFLIVVAVVDLLVFAVLYSVMKAGRSADRTSEAQARAVWASQERVRRETPLGGRSPAGVAGRRVFDAHGSMLGSAGELLADPLDSTTRWLEIRARGLGTSRSAYVPADGLSVSMNEVRIAFSRDHVLRAPVIASQHLTRDSELALCRHYGLSRRAGELSSRHPGELTGLPADRLGAASVAG